MNIISKKSFYRNPTKPFTSIIAGFSIHSLAILFKNIFHLDIIYAIICLIGWYYIILGAWKMKGRLTTIRNRYFPFLVSAYIILCVIMIIRGYLIDYPYQWFTINGIINFHLFNPTYILPYILPIIFFIPAKEFDFKSIVNWSLIFSWIAILSLLLFGKEMSINSIMQSFGKAIDDGGVDYKYYGQVFMNVGIVILCRRYITKQVWIINLLGLIASLLINVICARRGTSATLGLFLIISGWFYLKTLNPTKRIVRGFIISVTAIVITVVLAGQAAFTFIQKRGLEDNRSGVDIALMSQMDDYQKWFGKGLNGRYYYNLNLQNDRLGGWRYVSETGYYNLILKGGYVLTWIYILVIFIPALKGIRKSQNTLCKALGTVMLISLLQLIPFGHLAFNLQFLVIWAGVKLCMTPSILKASNRYIYQQYFLQENENPVDHKHVLS